MASDKRTSSTITDELLSQKKYDKINFRMDFIKELLNGSKLEPLIEFDKDDTEAYIAHHDHKDGECTDIRCILNKKYLNFGNVINQVGGKLMYVKSGTTGHTFKGSTSHMENDEKSINYAVKIVGYRKDGNIKKKYGDIYDIRRPENAELYMLRILSYFVKNGQTPHIVLPIATFNTSIKPFITLTEDKIVDSKKYTEFIENYRKGELYDEVSVLISEWANGGDLLDFIRNNYKTMTIKDWRVIFFQILSVLAIIQTKYPSFRHNDLKANNILLQKIDVRDKNNKFKYKINGMDYIVPNIGYQIKIWDFDFSCIPNIVGNNKVGAEWTKKINITAEKNRYYDMHFFFNTLTRKGFFDKFWDADEIPKKVKDFVRRIVPDQYREGNNVHERGRILTNVEYKIPDEVLKHDDFFSHMRPPKK